MSEKKYLFGLERCALIGMVHLPPLPGSPRWGGAMDAVIQSALEDAKKLVAGGCDALLVENMGDLPYLKGTVYPETVAAMTVAVTEVVGLGKPVGIQLLAGANKEALGVAVATGADFIRVEGFAYAHVADEGLLDASAGPLLRARSELEVDIQIWADVQKKHAAHAITADLSLEELAAGAVFCGADGLIVTGSATGQMTDSNDVIEVAKAGCPVVVGSGVSDSNVAHYLDSAAGVIVGSWLKHDGRWQSPVDLQRVHRLRKAMNRT